MLAYLTPPTLLAGSGASTITIDGASFVMGAQAALGATPLATTYLSPGRLTAAVPAGLLASAGYLAVTISNPAPSAGPSAPATLTIANPSPLITALTPAAANAGDPATLVTIAGAGFLTGASAAVDGVQVATSFGSPTQLVATIPAALLATGHFASLTVSNPAPTVGPSVALGFPVNHPSPVLSSLSPASGEAGAGSFTLTLDGASFVPATTVSFGGTSVPVTFVSSARITASISASLIATAAVLDVVATNPAPGGGSSTVLRYAANNLTPTLTALSPTRCVAPGATFTLTIDGASFDLAAQVAFAGTLVPTSYVTTNRLTATIPASLIASAGLYAVMVANPAPSEGASAALFFAVDNPAPSVWSLSPSSAPAGSASLSVTVNGAAFVAGSVASLGGVALPTTFVDSNTLVAAVPASLLAAPGYVNLTVTTGLPGGGTSAPVAFAVTYPTPSLTAITPSSAPVGSGGLTLTLSGSGFAAGAAVSFGGTPLATTFVSSAELIAVVPASLLASGGMVQVTAANPAPNAGSSGAVAFSVVNPTPALGTLTPSSILAGSASFTLTIDGSGFVPGAVARLGGTDLATTFLGPTRLLATVGAALLTTGSTPSLVVSNPAPSAGPSGALTLTVSNPAPVLSSLSPANAIAGAGGFTLALTGGSFASGATVTFNGATLPTTFVSASSLTAAIPAASVATAASFTVTVSNPAPSLVSSTSVAFSVLNPVPSLTALTPAAATLGSSATTVTIDGASFLSGAVATLGSTALATTFVSATRLTAVVPAAQLTTAGLYNLTVANPAPNAGASGALSFSVNNVTPALTTVTPASAVIGSGAITLTLAGNSFSSGAVASFNGTSLATTYVSSVQLTALVPAALLTAAGSFNVTVTNPAPSAGASPPVAFTVNNLAPVLTSLSPSSATINGASTTVTLSGSAFLAGAVASFNGTALATTFVSSTQLTAVVPAGQLTAAGNFNVTVANPAPAAGPSAAQVFVVNNVAPTLASYAPTSVNAGAAALTLTVTGSSFVSGAFVTYAGTNLATTFISSTELRAALPAAQVATAGLYNLTVSNPAPSLGASATRTFTVNNLQPTLSSLAPASATAGGAAFSLTINGASFVSGAQATFNGVAMTTSYVSSTQLVASIPASSIATVGNVSVTVANPTPSLGASTALTFAVNNATPTLSSLSPASATRGGATFTLTINGSSFVSGAAATFNGAAVTTTFVSASQLTAAIPAASIATAGTFNVAVTNPSSGASAPLSFAVNNAAPTLTSLSPSSATSGGTALTITVNGTGFVSGASVSFNGTALATTYVSATSLTAAVTTTAIATAGSFSVTVTNPAPTTGASSALTFTVNNPAPTLTSITPNATVATTGQFTLTLNGASFRSTSYGTFNGTALTTTYVSATQLTAVVPAASVASAGSYNVTVVSPTPGGGTSGVVSFTVTAPTGTGWTYNAAVPEWAVSGTNNVTATHATASGIWHTVLGARPVSRNSGVHYYELDTNLFQNASYIMVGAAATTYANPSPAGHTYFGSTGDTDGYGFYWYPSNWVTQYTPATSTTIYSQTTLNATGTVGVQLDTASNTLTFYQNNVPVWRAVFATMTYPVVPAIAVYATTGYATLLTNPAGQHYPERGGNAGWGNTACNVGYSWNGTTCVANPPISTSVASVAFGNQTQYWTSAPQTIAVTNSGSTSLTVSSVTVPAGFAQTNNCGTVAPGDTCAVTVTFTPTAIQAYSGNLTINNNTSTPAKTVALTGTGVAASAGWLPNAAVPEWALSGTNNTVATHPVSSGYWHMVLGAKAITANSGVHYFELNTDMMTTAAYVMLGVAATTVANPSPSGQTYFGSTGDVEGYGLYWYPGVWTAAYTPASSSTVYSSTMLSGAGYAGVRIDTATNTVALYLNNVLMWRAVFSSMQYPVVPALTVYAATGSATLVESAAAQHYPTTGNNAGW